MPLERRDIYYGLYKECQGIDSIDQSYHSQQLGYKEGQGDLAVQSSIIQEVTDLIDKLLCL
jgi:hypothetical protein